MRYVYVVQKLRELEGGNYCNFYNKGQPITQPIFDLHQHNVPQKNKFLMQIYHWREKNISLLQKNEKNWIFNIALFHIGVLCTKILNANSDI